MKLDTRTHLRLTHAQMPSVTSSPRPCSVVKQLVGCGPALVSADGEGDWAEHWASMVGGT